MNPIATITIQDLGSIQVELLPDNAPNSVASFIAMAQKGVYNGKPVKRIVPGYVIQPSYDDFGCPEAKFSIAGEFKVADGLEHLQPVKGTLILSGDGQTLSSGSCFCFVLDCDEEHSARLQDRFAVIGWVRQGYQVVTQIEQAETFRVDLGVPVEINEPVTPIVIQEVTVDTHGVSYPKPQVLEQGSIYEDH